MLNKLSPQHLVAILANAGFGGLDINTSTKNSKKKNPNSPAIAKARAKRARKNAKRAADAKKTSLGIQRAFNRLTKTPGEHKEAA
jgi:hypothetical protein